MEEARIVTSLGLSIDCKAFGTQFCLRASVGWIWYYLNSHWTRRQAVWSFRESIPSTILSQSSVPDSLKNLLAQRNCAECLQLPVLDRGRSFMRLAANESAAVA